MTEPGSRIPDEAELTEFYAEVSGESLRPERLIEPVMDDPLDVAKRYYREDNRPVLYDPQEERR